MADALEAKTKTHRFLCMILTVALLSCVIHYYDYLRRTRSGSSSPDDSVPRVQRFSVSWSHWEDCVPSPSWTTSWNDPQWQRLTDHIVVYSAYLITQKHPPKETVEIIAIVEIANDIFLANQTCICWFLIEEKRQWVNSEIRVETDRHGLSTTKYGDVRFICDVPANASTRSVSLECWSHQSCTTIHLPVHWEPIKPPAARLTFALCSSVFHGAVSASRLIEFIEYYKIIGIDKFVFYKHEVSRHVHWVLHHYQTEGILDIYDWTVPGLNMTNPSTDIWHPAQTAALNDCMERTGSLWTYTLTVALDEFLVINNNKRMTDLVRNGSDDCVAIRSAVMRLPVPNAIPTTRPISVVLKYSMRQSFIYPWYWRSETVCRGRTVMAASMHAPPLILPGVMFSGNRTADPDTEAILFHMREEQLDGEAGDWFWVSDERGLEYVERVAVAMERVLRKLGM